MSENLKPFNTLTEDEQRELRIRGGKKSGETRRMRKTLREQLDMLLSLNLKNDRLKKQIQNLGISEEEITNGMALTIAMYQEALKGNPRAFELIRDTIGEKPVDVVQNIEQPTIILERPKK